MAKKKSDSGVYRVTEIIGTSTVSCIAEVSKLDMKIEGGKVVAYRARVQLSFKYDA